MATKLQHKSSVPYNDPNGTSFFFPLLMHINENITHRSTTSQMNIGMITMQFSRSHGQPLQKPLEMQQMLRIFVCRSLVFHKHDAIYMTYVISLYYGNFSKNGTKQLGTMMPCMTHDNSFYYGKFHTNGTKKLGTMMVCITYVISFYFGNNTSSCIVLHNLQSYCFVLHHLASSCITLHHIASSCIALHRLASSCIVLHHLASSCITLHCLASPCITLHCLASSCIILHPLAPSYIFSLCNSRDLTDSSYRKLKKCNKCWGYLFVDPWYFTNMMPCMTYVISFYYGNFRINETKQLGTMMPCMTHDAISFYYGNFRINGTKKARYHDGVYNIRHFVLFWK